MMIQNSVELWSQVLADRLPDGTLHQAMEVVAANLEMLVQRPFFLTQLQVQRLPFEELRAYAGDPPLFDAAVFLHMSNDLPGWAVLTVEMQKSYLLVDWLLEKRLGTTYDLDPLALSALAEVGNIMLASFLNEISQFTGISIRPSPPSVVVDKLNTILELGAITVSTITTDLLFIETHFTNVEQNLTLRFWVFPDQLTFL